MWRNVQLLDVVDLLEEGLLRFSSFLKSFKVKRLVRNQRKCIFFLFRNTCVSTNYLFC